MHLWKRIAQVALSSTVHTALGQDVLDLGGDGWTVSSKALNISIPGHLPSQAHLDLLSANAIGNKLR